MSLFISTAHAAGEASQQPGLMTNLLMIAVFVAIFYFLIWNYYFLYIYISDKLCNLNIIWLSFQKITSVVTS